MRTFPSEIKVFAIVFGIFVLVTPLPASATHESGHVDESSQESTSAAYQFKNEGIFGCNQVAGANASAGTMAAIGGVYVPVNDAAVTLNTGIIVYKECVLRPLQDRLRESAVSALLKKQTVGIETGRGGSKRYVENLPKERAQVQDKSRLATLNNGAEAAPAAFRQSILRWNARTYQQETRAPQSILTCPYSDIDARINNQSDDSIGTVLAETNPACMPHLSALLFKELADARDAQAVADFMTMLDYGRGFYPVTDNANDPLAEKVLTPASVVQESYQQILNSPVEQLQSANDIGQMIGALFAGVTTQALTDSRGLAGLSQSVGGQPSYLDQVAKESSQGVIGAAVNAALQILRAYREFETRYYNAMSAVASALTQTINQLRSAERQCWALVVPKAQEYAQQNGFQIQVATSTAFSQQVIDSQISPLAQAALTNIQNSQKALALIDQIIAGVTNTASQNAVRLALQQLDNLVAQKSLHNQSDAVNAEKQKEDVAAAMETLRTDTIKAWGDSPDPSIGWCNINNPDIPRLWAERWKK